MEKWVGRVGGVWREPFSMMNSTNLAPEMILHSLILPWSVIAGIVMNYLALTPVKHVKAAQKETPTRICALTDSKRSAPKLAPPTAWVDTYGK